MDEKKVTLVKKNALSAVDTTNQSLALAASHGQSLHSVQGHLYIMYMVCSLLLPCSYIHHNSHQSVFLMEHYFPPHQLCFAPSFPAAALARCTVSVASLSLLI